MLLEKALVVRDTVLAEHEPVYSRRRKSSAILSQGMLFHFTKSRRSTGRNSRPPPTSNLCAGLESRETGRGTHTQPCGGRCGTFLRFADAKKGSQSARVINGRRYATGTQVDVVDPKGARRSGDFPHSSAFDVYRLLTVTWDYGRSQKSVRHWRRELCRFEAIQSSFHYA